MKGPIPTTPQPPKYVCRNKNQECPTNFDTSMWCTLYELVCTHSTNPYFDIYT